MKSRYNLTIETPTKKQFLRMGNYGRNGSGKTMSSLMIAQGMKNVNHKLKILGISCEHNRMQTYSDIADFRVIELKTFDPLEYIEAIKMGIDNKFGIIVIDQLSYAWERQLEIVDNLTRVKYNGNSNRAWGDPDAQNYNLLKKWISVSSAHFIINFRAKEKTETVFNEEKNKHEVQRIGLHPIEGKDMKYEFEFFGQFIGKGEYEIERDSVFREEEGRTVKVDYEFGSKVYTRLKEPFPIKYSIPEKTVKEKPTDKPEAGKKPEKETLPDLIKIVNEIDFNSIEQAKKVVEV